MMVDMVRQPSGFSPLRVAVVGTPRSGNTWLHRMLSASYDLDIRAVHRPTDLDWETLPAKCVIQIHWHPTKEFVDLLEKYMFKVVVLFRNPLDILISILHFSRHESQTSQWLNGEHGNESALVNSDPVSRDFTDYAVSHRAKVLLGLSAEWVELGMKIAVAAIYYEDFLENPVDGLRALGDKLGTEITRDKSREVVDAHSISMLKQTSSNYHFWQGRAGIYQDLILAADARRIINAHKSLFDCQRYQSVGTNYDLTAVQAQRNWQGYLC